MELIRRYHFGPFVSDLLLADRAGLAEGVDFIVADENTARLLPREPDWILPSGEKNKTLERIGQLLSVFAANKLSRQSRILALGGGLLCDLVGFAASVYMRGCKLILVPSSLLAMVDAGLGGKTGCNYLDYKNLIGSFYPASEVRIVPELLASLPAEEYQNGLGEVLKHALLSPTGTLWQKLKAAASGFGTAPVRMETEASRIVQAQGLRDLIVEAARIKGDIVEGDLYEQGERAFLNLGHTFGHALERVSSFEVGHGSAVVWGIIQALELSFRRGLCQRDYVEEVRTVFEAYGFVPDILRRRYGVGEETLSKLLDAMEMDKKKNEQGIRFILQRGRGETLALGVPLEEVRAVLTEHG